MSKRLQVDLNEEAYERLKRSAEEENRPIAEVVRRALNIEDYVRKQVQEGGTLLIRRPDGLEQELMIL
ncbi:MAG TPA: ribbon-helix-helix protein, CopG family [Solirubrobacterales bacterium]|nr:ribbon-helix-helix protein, CopG family [Solirubrobacterales bacterium]